MLATWERRNQERGIAEREMIIGRLLRRRWWWPRRREPVEGARSCCRLVRDEFGGPPAHPNATAVPFCVSEWYSRQHPRGLAGAEYLRQVESFTATEGRSW